MENNLTKLQLFGDLHGGNVLFAAPEISTWSEEQTMHCLGKPRSDAVERPDGAPIPPSMPRYLVSPASFRGSETEVKLVDLGQGIL